MLTTLTWFTLLTLLTVSLPHLPWAQPTHNAHHKLPTLTASLTWAQTVCFLQSPPADSELLSPPVAHLQLAMATLLITHTSLSCSSHSLHSPQAYCEVGTHCKLTACLLSHHKLAAFTTLCSIQARHAQCTNLAKLSATQSNFPKKQQKHCPRRGSNKCTHIVITY